MATSREPDDGLELGTRTAWAGLFCVRLGDERGEPAVPGAAFTRAAAPMEEPEDADDESWHPYVYVWRKQTRTPTSGGPSADTQADNGLPGKVYEQANRRSGASTVTRAGNGQENHKVYQRLESVSASPGMFAFPDHPKALSRDVRTPDELYQHVLLVGEEGAGVGHVLASFLCREGAKDAYKWIDLRDEPRVREAFRRLRDRGGRYVFDLRGVDFPGQRLDERYRTHLHELVAAADTAQMLRRHARIVVATRWVGNLQLDRDASTWVARAWVFRCPHFDSEELADWVRALAQTFGVVVDDESARRQGQNLKRWVGGQPTLVHLLLRRAQDRLVAQWRDNHEQPKTQTDIEKALEEAFHWMCTYEPQVVRSWIRHLEAVRASVPGVDRVISSFLDGWEVEYPAEVARYAAANIALFLAGWVGLRPPELEGHWTLRSEAHRVWLMRHLVTHPWS